MSGAAPARAEGSTRLAIADGIARITFDRPAARNAMTWHMYEELAEACATIAADPSVRVCILRGAGGKAFVAGTDITQFDAFASGEDGIAYEKKVERFIAGIEQLSVPTLAVVEGVAAGGGMAIANACDLRVAASGTRFGVPVAATLGNCLSASNLARLTANLGEAWVKRMLLLAEMPTAEEIAPTGYLAAVVPPEELNAKVRVMCAALKSHAPLTMAATKAALLRLRTDLTPRDEDLVRAVYGSADFKAGVKAFTQKRKAEWEGR